MTSLPRKLTVVSSLHTFEVPLPGEGTLTIGRQPDCDITIQDSSLSRKHAELTIHPSHVELRDLASRNGTMIGDLRLGAEAMELPDGVMALLGDVSIVVAPSRSLARRQARTLWSFDAFRARLQEECARSRLTSSVFAVARVRAADDAWLSEWQDTAASLIDSVALYGSGERFYLIFASDPMMLARRTAGMSELLAAPQFLYTAWAQFPGSGTTAEALLEALAKNESMAVTSSTGESDASVPSRNPRVRSVYELARRVAQAKINILVQGETGVGKDVLARWIHNQSDRAKQVFLGLNCAALAPGMLESELFGYEKGSFSGAFEPKRGLLEVADGGTVFLDEIGDMPLELQAKLLRVLE